MIPGPTLRRSSLPVVISEMHSNAYVISPQNHVRSVSNNRRVGQHRVLLTNPEQRASLAAARALASGGFEVITLGPARALAGNSRATMAHFKTPASQGALPDLDSFSNAVRAHSIDTVLPITDAACGLLMGSDDVLGATVAGATREAYLRASNKALVLQTAASCGLRVPEQLLLESPDDMTQLHWNRPAVVKPARSVVEKNGQPITVPGARYASDAESLREVLQSYPDNAYPLLLQERALGRGAGVFLFRVGGRTPLVYGHLRLREKPPSGGVSTYREAVLPPPELVSACERLLDKLEYEGPAMVEFKHDAASGDYVLMEINARLWGSLQLAIDAGLDFPGAIVRFANGEEVLPATATRPGVRSVWELGELDHCLALATRSRASLNVAASFPVGPGAAIKALFNHRISDRAEVFRMRDPMPFLNELSRWVRGR